MTQSHTFLLVIALLASSEMGTSEEEASTTPKAPAATPYTSTFNVKTVIFEACDLCNPCWTRDKLALLLARRAMQDLIPKKLPKNFPLLLKYLKASIQAMKARASARNLNLMTVALYDAFGGYLHSIVIPLLNEAYYAGNVDYYTTSEFHRLLGDIMDFLNTNGGTWANPCDMRKIPTKVTGLNVKVCKTMEACNCFSPAPEPSNPSCPATTPSAVCRKGPKIPIPFLDDNKIPNAVAIPLKDRSLFSLMSECSINILPKYYLLAMRCLNTPNFTQEDVVLFNRHFHRWIIVAVVPHLHLTDRWFPGFGGVMRVIETMNERGLASGESLKCGANVMADRIPTALDFDVEPVDSEPKISHKKGLEKSIGHGEKQIKGSKHKKNGILTKGGFTCGPTCILVIVLVGILVLVCLLFLLVILLVKAKNEKDEKKRKSLAALGVKDEEELINTLVSIYCDGKNKDSRKCGKKSKRNKDKRYQMREDCE